MKKYQLPKEFAEKWLAILKGGKEKFDYWKNDALDIALRIGKYKKSNPNGIYNQDLTFMELVKMQNPIYEIEVKQGASFIDVADWVEQNVEMI